MKKIQIENKKSHYIWLLLVIFVPALILYFNKVKLGLDLRGGTSVVLQAQGKIEADTMSKVRNIIERRVNSIGVAKCDPLGILATALEVIDRTKTNPVERIKEILDDEDTKKVVVGMPKSLDGTKKRQVEKVEEFVEELKKSISNIQIIFVDERYTTTEAEHYLKNYSKKNGKERRKVVDMVAASIILQKYLDTLVQNYFI